MSNREKSSEQDKSPERQMIVQGFLFVFVLVPAIFVVCSIVISDYVAQTPPVRSFDDAARQTEIAACESQKGYKNTEDCYK
ncbi:hypothetical protein H1Q63_17410 [Desmonostoc muscorum CCALA 125]|nr:hypothetical protein [Desmonostoc muscorum CCALA 125]